MFSRLLYAAETWTIKANDARKLLVFEMRCYRRILKICWKDKVSNKVIRERAKRQWTVMDLIKQETQTFWPHLQNGRQKTHQDRDARNGERQQATRKTGKEVARRHCRVDWCGCSLQEAVQLANDRQSWRRVTGLNSSHGP